jgi:NtrC-family two-component system sensor histidine kinase KinB
MTLRTRILTGYGVALGLTAVVLLWAVFNLLDLGRASSAILHENYRSILAAHNMLGAIDRQDNAELLTTLGHQEEGLRQFSENESRFLQWLARAKDNVTIPGEGQLVSDIDTTYSSYLVVFSSLSEMQKTAPEKAKTFYHETALPLFKKIRRLCERLSEINQDTMFRASRQAEHVAHRAFLSTLAIGLAGIAAGLGFSLLLSKSLVRPLEHLMTATQALAGGDYDVQVPAAGSDEMGQLASDFNAMARKLGAYHRLNVDQVIDEKRKADAVLRSIEDGVVVIDAELKIDNMNPTAGRIFDASPDQARGRHFLEIIRQERLFEFVKEAAASGAAPRIDEDKDLLTVGKGASARHYTFAVTPVVTESRRMLGVVLLLRDVTRLKELDRLKSEFVMTASHELRTPLQSLIMSIDLLLEPTEHAMSEKQRRLLQTAHEELQRLRSLVNDLLDLSRIEAGKVEMQFDSVPVGMMIEKAAGVFKTQVHQQEVHLILEVPRDVPPVRADANKITWVLTNLLSNALRYVARGGNIRVNAEHVGEWVHVSVTDDGEGIPPEYQSRIFDKFVQVEGSKALGGTGLGLAICREIVRAHTGTIWVESAPAKGSTFVFTLPVAKQ